MRRTFVGLALAVALSAAAPATAATITFDGIASGTVINTMFPGLTFSNPAPGAGMTSDIYAAAGLAAGNNVVTVFAQPAYPGFDARFGAVDVAFAETQTTVSIDVTPQAPAEGFGTPVVRPFLQAWDLNNVLLGTVLYAGALPVSAGPAAATETLTFSNATGISRVRFSVQNPLSNGGQFVYGMFDNLTYDNSGTNGGGNNGGGTPLPEPASVLLAALGMAGVLARRQRRA